MRKDKGLLVAGMDADAATEQRPDANSMCAGQYSRPGVFRLHVNRAKQIPISFD